MVNLTAKVLQLGVASTIILITLAIVTYALPFRPVVRSSECYWQVDTGCLMCAMILIHAVLMNAITNNSTRTDSTEKCFFNWSWLGVKHRVAAFTGLPVQHVKSLTIFLIYSAIFSPSFFPSVLKFRIMAGWQTCAVLLGQHFCTLRCWDCLCLQLTCI